MSEEIVEEVNEPVEVVAPDAIESVVEETPVVEGEEIAE